MVGWHKDQPHRAELAMEGGRCRALAHPAQPRQGDTAKAAGTGGLIPAPCGAGGVWCPRAAPPHPIKHPTSTVPPAAPAPRPGLARPSMPHGLAGTSATAGGRGHQGHPTGHTGDARGGTPGFRESQGRARGRRTGVQGRGAGLGLQLSCGDVAGMCVGGRQGGGEGGRGSGRGSSSFDKQLPEHFQTVVFDRHARCPWA